MNPKPIYPIEFGEKPTYDKVFEALKTQYTERETPLKEKFFALGELYNKIGFQNVHMKEFQLEPNRASVMELRDSFQKQFEEYKKFYTETVLLKEQLFAAITYLDRPPMQERDIESLHMLRNNLKEDTLKLQADMKEKFQIIQKWLADIKIFEGKFRESIKNTENCLEKFNTLVEQKFHMKFSKK